MYGELQSDQHFTPSQDMPVTEYILKRIDELCDKGYPPVTLLAVCPNSLAVIRAALSAAKRNNAPVKFAATLNQVDYDRGYTGFTQEEFVRYINSERKRINFTGPVIIAVDHGGPWLKDIQAVEKWPSGKAMDGIKRSLEDAVRAGYHLLHVDPTVDIFLEKGTAIPIELVVSRTVELIDHTEVFREKNKFPQVSYEVGTEEVHGGLADDKTFDLFITLLKKGLAEKGRSNIWPCFIVGKVGTDLHTATFDRDVAISLAKKVKPLGSRIKGHYTDGVNNPADYPGSGMGAANVGPEFTVGEYEALLELEAIEKKLFRLNRAAVISDIGNMLGNAVFESGRWKKWLQPDEQNMEFSNIGTERRRWLISTGCRYIWQKPEIVVARYRLYENLASNGIDAEEIVLLRIQRDMDKYFRSFNLINLNNYL